MYAQQCISASKRSEARETVSRAYGLLLLKEHVLSDLEKVRLIGLSTKLAELFEEEGNLKDAEDWYSISVSSTLRWFKFSVGSGRGLQNDTVVFPHTVPSLASWLFGSGEREHLRPDPSAPFVNIARLYSREGRVMSVFLYHSIDRLTDGLVGKLLNALYSLSRSRTLQGGP